MQIHYLPMKLNVILSWVSGLITKQLTQNFKLLNYSDYKKHENQFHDDMLSAGLIWMYVNAGNLSEEPLTS